MTVRWEELNADTQALYPQENLRQPLRIIIDSQNRVTPSTASEEKRGPTAPTAEQGRGGGRRACPELWCRNITGISISWC